MAHFTYDFFELKCSSGSWTAHRWSLGAGVFGDGLGALRHGVFGEFSGQQQPDCSLHLSARDGRPLVIVSEPWGLCSDALEHIINKRVHDAHRPAGDTSVGMNLWRNTHTLQIIWLKSHFQYILRAYIVINIWSGLKKKKKKKKKVQSCPKTRTHFDFRTTLIKGFDPLQMWTTVVHWTNNYRQGRRKGGES